MTVRYDGAIRSSTLIVIIVKCLEAIPVPEALTSKRPQSRY